MNKRALTDSTGVCHGPMMNNHKAMLPGPGFGAGHTNQCGTLAEGLRQVSEALESDLAAFAQEGFGPDIASRRLEARFATVTVLAAALCECMANTILAANMTGEEFATVEQIGRAHV